MARSNQFVEFNKLNNKLSPTYNLNLVKNNSILVNKLNNKLSPTHNLNLMKNNPILVSDSSTLTYLPNF